MPLNDRKIRILEAIINDYIATAEPVGSRTIAKKYDLGISSATIRNEMSDLEEMGLIIQPHASSGRIPSDLGYRLYVDRLMKSHELSSEEIAFLQSVFNKNIERIDFLMEETAKILSRMTNYTTIISEPVSQTTLFKQIRLLPLDEQDVMFITATKENKIKNHIIKTAQHLSDNEIFKISEIINNNLSNKAVENMTPEILDKLKAELGEYDSIIEPVIKALHEDVKNDESIKLHLSGAKNILTFPEFSDINKAKSLFQTLEEKDVLVTLLDSGSEGEDVQIYIGNENSVQEMKDCSLVTTTYKVGNNTKGSIGIIGPTRMDYSQVVSVLNTMVKNVESVLNMLTDPDSQKSGDTKMLPRTKDSKDDS